MMRLEWDTDALWAAVKEKDHKPLADFWLALRKFCPKPGTDWVRPAIVQVNPGKEIAWHSHPEWTILYYLDPCDAPILLDKPYLPEIGEVLLLEPNVRHAVAINETDRRRVTLALLVEADEQG